MPDSKPQKSKWGISNMLHKERERPSAATDSAYGSEPSSSNRDSYNSAPSLTDSNRSQQTYQHPETFVNDAGQTVTTTTTTTTTTTSGHGGSSQTSGPHTSNLANKLDPRVSSGNEQTEVTEVRRETERPNIPDKSTMRERSPNPAPPQGRQAPQIQPNPPRGHREPSPGFADPASPSGRHNFSYPGRGAANGQVPPQAQYGQQQQQSPSTLQNLKTAAVGIHGVGETLRGTVNSSVDKRFHGSPETMAAHNQTLNAGRSEIQSGQLHDSSRQAGGIGNPVKGILRKRGSNGQLRVVNE